jgi:acetoin utilization deacetylase AcuC-like enzyme
LKETVGIITDKDFEVLNDPPYPRPYFESFESPLRIKSIMDYFNKTDLFEDSRVKQLPLTDIDDSVIELVHSKYHIQSIKYLSDIGSGDAGESVFITKDTYNLAKKAVGATISALSSVINNEVNQSFAFIRPPGHHALRDVASGLCIFNNIAIAIQYLRKVKQAINKVAIVDIDNHYGDGIAKFFYEDPDILYFSIHEYDFDQGELGFIFEIGEGDGLGKNINFPIPPKTTDKYFLELFDIVDPIFSEFKPELIVIACGFDGHFTDPIGNCMLTANAYIQFTHKILDLAKRLCNGKLSFVLEGGYSQSALPICSYSIIQTLLGDQVELPFEEKISLPEDPELKNTISRVKAELINILKNFWPIVHKL